MEMPRREGILRTEPTPTPAEMLRIVAHIAAGPAGSVAPKGVQRWLLATAGALRWLAVRPLPVVGEREASRAAMAGTGDS